MFNLILTAALSLAWLEFCHRTRKPLGLLSLGLIAVVCWTFIADMYLGFGPAVGGVVALHFSHFVYMKLGYDPWLKDGDTSAKAEAGVRPPSSR